MTKLMFVVAVFGTVSACTSTQRRYTIDDLENVREPSIPMLSPDGGTVSYVLGDTLWIVPVLDGREARAVSRGMSNQINYDEPFQAWSPDGMRLLYRTGTDGPSGLGVPMVYDLSTGTKAPLLPAAWGERLQTFMLWTASGPTWSSDGARVALMAVDTASRFKSHLGLYVVDVDTRMVTLVASDTAGVVGGVWSAAWSPDGRWLAYGTGGFAGSAGRLVLLRADGSGQKIVLRDGAPMYRRLDWSPDGKMLSVLPHGGQGVLLQIDERGGAQVVSEAVPLQSYHWTTDRRLIGLERRGMSAVPVVWSPGDASVTPLALGDTLFRLAGVASGVGATSLVAFTKETGGLPVDIWTAELAPGASRLSAHTRVTRTSRWLDSVAVAHASVVHWSGPGGDTLDALFFRPAQATGQPYPLIVRPYGSYVNAFPKSEYFMDAGTQLLVAEGWAVIQPNTRGMSSEPLTGRYGEVQLEDTRVLIDTLLARGLVDPERIAVIGHSHGGAMAYYYLTHDDAFCGVVAVNGWSDWSQIGGRLRATDAELPAKLQRFSPILNGDRVNAELLAVSGAGDTQVLPENAARMVDVLRALNKPAELLHFEDEGHVLTQPKNRRLFWTSVLGFLARSCA